MPNTDPYRPGSGRTAPKDEPKAEPKAKDDAKAAKLPDFDKSDKGKD